MHPFFGEGKSEVSKKRKKKCYYNKNIKVDLTITDSLYFSKHMTIDFELYCDNNRNNIKVSSPF